MKGLGTAATIAGLLLVCVPLLGAEGSNLAGHWVGVGDPWGGPLQVELEMNFTGGNATRSPPRAPTSAQPPLAAVDGL